MKQDLRMALNAHTANLLCKYIMLLIYHLKTATNLLRGLKCYIAN